MGDGWLAVEAGAVADGAGGGGGGDAFAGGGGWTRASAFGFTFSPPPVGRACSLAGDGAGGSAGELSAADVAGPEAPLLVVSSRVQIPPPTRQPVPRTIAVGWPGRSTVRRYSRHGVAGSR